MLFSCNQIGFKDNQAESCISTAERKAVLVISLLIRSGLTAFTKLIPKLIWKLPTSLKALYPSDSKLYCFWLSLMS